MNLDERDKINDIEVRVRRWAQIADIISESDAADPDMLRAAMEEAGITLSAIADDLQAVTHSEASA
jgi:hypothetical protein